MKKVSFGFKVLQSVVVACLLVFCGQTTADEDDAGQRQSPLRGHWSFSQIVPSTTLLTTPPGGPVGPAVPLVAVGTLRIDESNQFTGNAGFNTPVVSPDFPDGFIPLGFDGHCTPRDRNYRTGLDCIFNFPEFQLFGINRYCVVMAKEPGRCYDEFRCVNIDEPGETVALTEFKRQRSGTCR
ncbi:MAG: hypothetical protein ACU84Q_07610 [Gammaproteobacteria bacterium]